MSVKVSGKYLGNKKIEITHLSSGAKITTDAPVDNNGEGKLFSPTDLVAAALGACVTTIMAIHGERDGIDLTGMYFEAEKHMAQNPRRICPLTVVIHLPKNLNQEYREKLERAGGNCPVHHSLSEGVQAEITYVYDV